MFVNIELGEKNEMQIPRRTVADSWKERTWDVICNTRSLLLVFTFGPDIKPHNQLAIQENEKYFFLTMSLTLCTEENIVGCKWTITLVTENLDGSTSKMNSYQSHAQGFILSRSNDLFHNHHIKISSGVCPTSYPKGKGALSLSVKCQEHQGHLSPTCNSEVKNGYAEF
jgi:hypothetical protein